MDSPRTHLPIPLAIFLTFVCPLHNGSMNFTEGEENTGNPLILHGERKLAECLEHLEQSEKFEGVAR